ncbi:hypothetical protein ACSENY_01055 [Pseudomonas aeruginosa]
MSSTQHQLIEQCATRLRGIVEALDNIHDTSPHRWSTDLDDVHSSAESLLAMINDQASNQADLAQPSPRCTTCGGAGMVDDGEITCSEGGIPYENGPVKCVKDCPSCKAHPSPTQPEDAPVIGCLCGMPMTEGHHSPDGCCNLEEFAPQAQVKQAEAERPPQPERYTADVFHPERPYYMAQTSVVRASDFDEFATQYERIVGALRAKLQAAEDRADTLEHRMMGMMTRHFAEAWRNRDTQKAPDGYLSAAIAQLEQERDAALANVDALVVQVLKLGGTISFDYHPVAQAGQVPQAWLDVQAERRRQVEVEGWTPEHDDEHDNGEMALAAASYAAYAHIELSGDLPFCWPWDQQWWKPTTTRRDLVKACALGLAEIERLDRAGISQNPQPGATTASS